MTTTDLEKLGNQFDLLTTQHESGDATGADGRRRLRLRNEAVAQQAPNLYRQMDMVQMDLVATFRLLALGQLPWPLFLHGDVGTGKTLAALSLADFVTTARYWTLEGLCDKVMDPDTKTQEMWGNIQEKELTILDEIGERSKVGDLLYTTVKKHLDLREQHAGRVGIYISNLTPEQLVQMFDKRIVSRLTAGTVFELSGDDRRKQR